MKKIIRLIVTAAVIIIVVLLFNTLTLSSKQVTSESLEKVSLPNEQFILLLVMMKRLVEQMALLK